MANHKWTLWIFFLMPIPLLCWINCISCTNPACSNTATINNPYSCQQQLGSLANLQHLTCHKLLLIHGSYSNTSDPAFPPGPAVQIFCNKHLGHPSSPRLVKWLEMLFLNTNDLSSNFSTWTPQMTIEVIPHLFSQPLLGPCKNLLLRTITNCMGLSKLSFS